MCMGFMVGTEGYSMDWLRRGIHMSLIGMSSVKHEDVDYYCRHCGTEIQWHEFGSGKKMWGHVNSDGMDRVADHVAESAQGGAAIWNEKEIR